VPELSLELLEPEDVVSEVDPVVPVEPFFVLLAASEPDGTLSAGLSRFAFVV